MRCNDFKAIWQPWTDGELSADMSALAAKHQGSCEECASWDIKMRSLEEGLLLAGEETVEPPPFLMARILANLDSGKPGLLEQLRAFFAPRRLAAVAVVAAAFATGMVTMDAIHSKEGAKPLVASRVVLEFDAPGADAVGLVGDFNQWGRKEVPIEAKRDDNRWIFELELVPGRYQYAFEVNGKKWLPDPRAKGIIPDGFGGNNSVLYVPAQAGLDVM